MPNGAHMRKLEKQVAHSCQPSDVRRIEQQNEPRGHKSNTISFSYLSEGKVGLWIEK